MKSVQMQIQPLALLLALLSVVLGGCFFPEPQQASNAPKQQSKPTPAAPKSKNASVPSVKEEAPLKLSPDFEERCRRRFPAEFAEITALEMSSPKTESVIRVSRIIEEAQPCVKHGVIDEEGYRQALIALRKAFAQWYELAPAVRSAALAGDVSVFNFVESKRTSDGLNAQESAAKVDIPYGRTLAEIYLFTHTELARIHKGAPEKLDEELDLASYPHALITVDASSGVLLNLLEQQAEDNQSAIKQYLTVWGKSLRTEGTVWQRSMDTKTKTQDVKLSSKRNVASRKLEERLFFVSVYTKNIAMLWGSRPNEDMRSGLGAPYRDYLLALYNGDVKRRQESSTTPAPKEPEFQWIVGVEFQESDGAPFDHANRMTLGRMLLEVSFDDLNLRAMLETRYAEIAWSRLFRLNRTTQASKDEILDAGEQLLKAMNHTDAPRARIQAVARVVSVVDLLDGRSVQNAPEGPPRRAGATPNNASAEAVTAMRKGASRLLSELTLCLLNHAYLKNGNSSVCAGVMSPIVDQRAKDVDLCRAEQIDDEFEVGSRDVRPASEELRRGYQRIIGAMEQNWTAPVVLVNNQTTLQPSRTTLCEINRAFDTRTIGRLGLDTRTYADIISLIALKHLRIPMEQVGPLLSQGVFVAYREQQTICGAVGTISCTLDDLNVASIEAGRLNEPKNKGRIEIQKDRYCVAARLGAQMVAQASPETRNGGNSPTNNPTSLIERAKHHLKPLSERELMARGGLMAAEAQACESN